MILGTIEYIRYLEVILYWQYIVDVYSILKQVLHDNAKTQMHHRGMKHVAFQLALSNSIKKPKSRQIAPLS